MSFSLMLALAALAATPCNPPEPVSPHDIAVATGALPKTSDSFLVATVTTEEGPKETRVFVRERGRWLAYDQLGFSSDIVSDKRARGGRRMVRGWHTSEGPGQSFEGVIYTPGAPLVCAMVDFSTVANRNETTGEFDWMMEFLSLDDVNIDVRGHGAFVASGDLDIAGRERHVVYEFRTRDGGRTWTAPRRIQRVYRPAGIYLRQ